MISDDCNVLPAQLADEVAAAALKDRPTKPLIDALVARAEATYARSREFREGVQRPGARGRSYLHAFMRGWAAEWVAVNYQKETVK